MKTVGLEAMRRHIEQLTADLPVVPRKLKRLHQAKVLTDPDSGEVLELQLPAIHSASATQRPCTRLVTCEAVISRVAPS